jgi:hypothetical protein
MFVPRLGTIPRYIITKEVNEACVKRIAFSKGTVWIWHALQISSTDDRF